MAEHGGAFLKGGFGCLAAVIVVGLVLALFGACWDLTIGEVTLLFVVGGVIGLAAAMMSGRRDRNTMPP